MNKAPFSNYNKEPTYCNNQNLMESQVSLNTISFHKNFHIKLVKADDPDSPIYTKIEETDYREGTIPYENLISLLMRENPFSDVPNSKIKYLDETTNNYFVLKKGSVLDPHNFKKGYVEIKLEKENKSLLRHHSDDLGKSLSQSNKKDYERGGRIEELEKEISSMKMNFEKMKLLISAIIKNSSFLTEDFIKIIKFAYEPEEYEKLGFDEGLRYENFNQPVLKREHSLLPQLQIMEEISTRTLETKQSSLNSPLKKNSIDFGILYSYPLVAKIKKKGKTYTSPLSSDPVDFSGECIEILKSFKNENKSLKCHIECATSGKLAKLLQQTPLVLHICCHGEYDKQFEEYYLEFENERAELLKLTPNKLRNMLKGEDLSNIKIAFVNACHSEAVARVFFEFGITSIVVVSSRHKINDVFAKNFSNLFYRELMHEKTINEAFEKAKLQLNAMHLDHPDSCCCGHAHKPDCEWFRTMKTKGMYNAHCEHVPCCDCPKAEYHIHSEMCQWADNFLLTYDAQFEVIDEETQEMRVCCCSPELSHDEIMKLKLIYKDDDPRHGEKVVFKNLKNGDMKQVNPHFFAGTQFKDCNVMGNKRLIYQMFNAVANEGVRIIYLKGQRESGKSAIAKFFANYCEERHKVDDVKYINMENTSSIHVFLAKIPNYFDTSANKMAYTHGEGTLVILDNMDTLLQNYFKEFDRKITEIISQSNLKFLIITINHEFLKGKVMNGYEKTTSVGKLDEIVAAKMLIKMKKSMLPFLYRNPIELSNHQIFKGASNTPRRVSNIAFLLSKGYQLDEIHNMLENEDEGQENMEDKNTEKEKRMFLS